MIERKSWEDFRSAGLLWWVNRGLHLFGWAICAECADGRVTDIYPARVKFRGFDAESEAEGFKNLTGHLAGLSPELIEEVRE